MSSFPPLSSLPSGLQAPAGAGWERARSAPVDASVNGNAAEVFGFNGPREAARVLSVPPPSGATAAQLEERFLRCLFQR